MRNRSPLAFLVAVLGCAHVHADVLTVTNVLDDLANPPAGSLRKTIADAQSGDTITFAPAATGTVTLAGGELLLDKNLTIQGPGAATLAISGNQKSRVFRVPAGITATIGRLTIRDGKAPKGADVAGVTPPEPGGPGGAVYNSGELTITECVVTSSSAGAGGNRDSGGAYTAGAGGHGGAIANVTGTLTVRSSTISDNKAGNGGTFSAFGGNGGGVSSVDGTMVLTDCTISRNIAGGGSVGGNGGGIYASGGTAHIERCTIERNKPGFGVGYPILTASAYGGTGGGIRIAAATVATIETCTITGNICGESEVDAFNLWSRTATPGAGITTGGTVTISSSTISGNIGFTSATTSSVFARGAGINAEGTLTVSNTIVAKNNAGNGGQQDVLGNIISGGHNLIGAFDAAHASGIVAGANGDKAGTPVAPIDPRLGSLTTYGTSTAVLPVLPDSPAMDAGDDQLGGTDQRGMPRLIGAHVDIGAVEAEAVIEFSSATTTASEGEGTVAISLTRAGNTSGAASAQYSITGGTATEGSDFTISGNAIFAPDEVQRTISVTLINDAVVELPETIELSLNGPSSGAAVGAKLGHVIQLNDDDGTGKIAFATGGSSILEGSAKAVISVTRADGDAGQLSVAFQTTAGTAGTSDFTGASGTLTFASGVTEQTIEIPILDDWTIESPEEFTVALSALSGGGTLVEPKVHTVTIQDDDAPAILQFASSTSTTAESGTATITVTRGGNTMRSASAGYVFVDGSATNGSDYTTSFGSVIFAPGVTQQTITVPIIEDSTLEGDETFQVKLSSISTFAEFGPQTTHTVTITNDDAGRPAEVFTVTNSSDDPLSPAPDSLRQLIADAQYGDTITFALGVSGAITLGGAQIVIDKKLTIVGPGAEALALSGNQASRIFEIKANGTLNVTGLTLRDGKSVEGASGLDGGAILSAGSVTLENCALTNNVSGTGSGGSGGAVSSSGPLTMSRCVLTSNRAGDGAASFSSVPFSVHGGGNGGNGGAISCSGNLTLTDCTISGNQSGKGGYAGKGAGSQIAYPGYGGLGGGIFVAGNFLIERCCIANNRSGDTGSGHTPKHADLGGGGLAVAATGSGELKTSTVSTNVAGNSGSFDSNAVIGAQGGSGGGIHTSGNLAITSCTVLNNTTGKYVPPFFVPPGNSYASYDGKGGGIFSKGTTTVRNTIIAQNHLATSSDGNLGHSVSGSFTSAGHNLIESSFGSSGFTFGQNADLIGVVPNVLPLSDNGGPTQTHALASFSAAVNAGDDSVTGVDQCLNPRLAGPHVDIGAYEFPSGGNPIVSFHASASQVAESVGNATIEVTRVGETSTSTAVEFSITPGTATAGSDYTSSSGTIQFAANQTQAWITIPVTDDGSYETAETFTINLISPSGNPSLGYRSAHTVTIVDNDLPVIQFDGATSTVYENSGTVEITLLRSGDLSVTSSVSYTTTNGTAIANSDYTPSNGSINFGPGVSQQKLVLALIKDGFSEAPEHFSIQLTAPSTAELGGTPTRLITIIEDYSSTLNFAVAATSVSETAGQAFVKIIRFGGAENTVSVSYQTSAGTAIGNGDFTPVSGTLSFAPSVTEQTIAIPIVDNSTIEATESFLLTLSAPTNGAVIAGSSSHTVTIIDDDEFPSTLAFADAGSTVSESAGVAHVIVKRTGGTTSSVTVHVAALSGSATPGTDFSLVSNTVTFGPGVTEQVVSIALPDDWSTEPSETCILTLQAPGLGAALGIQDSHTLTISDDDSFEESVKATYLGLLDEEKGSRAAIAVNTTATGRLTGTFRIDGRTLPFQGRFPADGLFTKTFSGNRSSHFEGGTLSFRLTEGGNRLSVAFQPPNESEIRGAAKRAKIGTRTNPVPEANAYTAILGGNSPDQPAGFVRFVVQASGRTIVSGKTPTGATLATASHVALDGSLSVFCDGKVGGWLEPDPADATLYRGEFRPLWDDIQGSLEVRGAPYHQPHRARILDDFDSNSGAAKFAVTIPGEATAEVPVLWKTDNSVRSTAANALRPTIQLQARTGLFNGKLVDESGRSRRFWGACLQMPYAAADRAVGFSILRRGGVLVPGRVSILMGE